MGNAIARENGSGSELINGARSESGDMMQEATEAVSNDGASRGPHGLTVRVGSADLAMASPPRSPPHFNNSSPLVFNPQVPVAPLPLFNQMQRNEAVAEGGDRLPVRGLPILITWSHGGNNVAVEGSWDNWRSRRPLQRAGKDHTLLLVLPCGLHRYRFIVDGEMRHILDLPTEADPTTGRVCNLLDVQDYIPDNCDGVKEFEVPGSPESSYGQNPLTEEDFAKEPFSVPPQLDQTDMAPQAIAVVPPASSVQKPPHVVLDHLFVEKGWASQSVLALGLTHRFQQKYVTVVLYKPIKR